MISPCPNLPPHVNGECGLKLSDEKAAESPTEAWARTELRRSNEIEHAQQWIIRPRSSTDLAQ
jgi:hypothetical protein